MRLAWVDAFLEAQAAELDAAENTRLAYARDLKDFDGWLAARGLADRPLVGLHAGASPGRPEKRWPHFVPLARRLAAAGLVSCLGLAFWVEWEIWLLGLGVIAAGLVWHRLSPWRRAENAA